MLRFDCPYCQAGLKVRPEFAGAAFVCPRCQKKALVPAATRKPKEDSSVDSATSPTNPSPRPEGPKSRKAARPAWVWLAAGISGGVLLLACLGISGFLAVFAVLGSPTPQERIVGTWDAEELVDGLATRTIFYSDGVLVAPAASFDVRELRYRFVDDQTIEVALRPSQLTSASRPMRLQVRFLS